MDSMFCFVKATFAENFSKACNDDDDDDEDGYDDDYDGGDGKVKLLDCLLYRLNYGNSTVNVVNFKLLLVFKLFITLHSNKLM